MFEVILFFLFLLLIPSLILLLFFFLSNNNKIDATDEEMKVLMTIRKNMRAPLLNYLRTLEASDELQQCISGSKECLHAIQQHFKCKFNKK